MPGGQETGGGSTAARVCQAPRHSLGGRGRQGDIQTQRERERETFRCRQTDQRKLHWAQIEVETEATENSPLLSSPRPTPVSAPSPSLLWLRAAGPYAQALGIPTHSFSPHLHPLGLATPL